MEIRSTVPVNDFKCSVDEGGEYRQLLLQEGEQIKICPETLLDDSSMLQTKMTKSSQVQRIVGFLQGTPDNTHR